MRNDKENPIVDKSFQFAVEIVEFCDLLYQNKKYVIFKFLPNKSGFNREVKRITKNSIKNY